MKKYSFHEKSVKKALKLQKITQILNKIHRMKDKLIGKENFINTSFGNIRVLEYGFEDFNLSPLFIDMHGGGFIMMSADIDEYMNLKFQKKLNIKIISIDYPKAPRYPYPIAIEAVYETIKYYILNSEKLGIDTSKIGIGGHSAGANLATVICMKALDLNEFQFKYQILDYPPLDLYADPFLKDNPKKAIPPKMAAMFNECYVNHSMAKEPYASPIYATDEMLKNMPPTLIIVAGQDSLHNEGILYANKLQNAGVNVTLHDFKNSAHGFTYEKNEDAIKAHNIIIDFIEENI